MGKFRFYISKLIKSFLGEKLIELNIFEIYKKKLNTNFK